MATAAFVLAAAGGLVALAAGAPRPGLAEPGRDPLAIEYLRAAIAERPDDLAIRLRLAREQLATGRFADTEDTLAPLIAVEQPEAMQLATDAALAAWRAAPPDTPDRARAAARAAAWLEHAEAHASTVAALVPIETAAHELGRPAIAARATERAAEIDRERCAEWFARASRDHLGAGDPARAADTAVRAYDCAGGGAPARELARIALELVMADGRAGDALVLADRVVARFPEDGELLARAETLARAAGDVPRARRFAGLLTAHGSPDALALERLFDLDLAAGDLPAALRTAERLARAAPGDRRKARLVARVAAWTGRPRLSLARWMTLARRGDATGYAHALQLSRELSDDRARAELLERAARQRPLPPAHRAELVAALERLGATGRAAAVLAAEARRSDDDAAWDQLVGFHERHRDLSAAIDARAESTRRRGATLVRSMSLAKLQWATGRGDAALVELARWTAAAGPDATAYWRLVAELAWQEESDDLASRAYRALWDAGTIDAVGVERLMILAHDADRHADAIAYGEDGWTRLGEPRLLLVAMDEAAHANAWDRLAKLRTRAARDEARFADSLEYWLLSAELARHEGRDADAATWYRRALSVDAGAVAARTGLVWALIDGGDRDELAATLAGWADDAAADPRLWRAFGAGYERLGRTPEALAFYGRAADDGDLVARDRYLAMLDIAEPPPAAPPPRSGVTTAEAAITTLGAITLERLGASARSAVTSDVELIARAGWARVTDAAGGREAVDVLAGVAVTALGGKTEVLAGAGIQGGDAVARAMAAHARTLAPRAELRAEAGLNDVPTESAALSVDALRTRAGAALAMGTERLYGRVVGEWKRWSTRSGSWIGRGGAGGLELGVRARLDDPEVALRISGGYQRNQLAMSPAEGALLPVELATIGAGLGLARWRIGKATVLADAWLGVATPPLRAAYRVQSGIALVPFAHAELALAGYLASDAWVVGRGELGIAASIAYRFPPP